MVRPVGDSRDLKLLCSIWESGYKFNQFKLVKINRFRNRFGSSLETPKPVWFGQGQTS